MEIANPPLESMVNMTRKFWQNKKVLITGHEGFLGSNLTKRLLDYGAKVTGIDIRTNRRHTILDKADLKRINTIKGSIENYKLVRDILHQNKIEFIFHLAAQAIVGKSLKYPSRTFSTNIKGTWNILEASRGDSRIKSIVIASSDKAYGIHSLLPYREDASLAGCYPYDVSKSCADLLAHTYSHTYNLPVCVTRCGNIYGPGDFHFSRIVPDAVKSALQNKTLIIRSNGKYTRDYIYVEDVLDGYFCLAEKMQTFGILGQAFNFSDESPLTVIELVSAIYRLANRKPDYKILNLARCEIEHQYLSAAKARKLLGWEASHTLKEGLRETIAWYKKYFNSDFQGNS